MTEPTKRQLTITNMKLAKQLAQAEKRIRELDTEHSTSLLTKKEKKVIDYLVLAWSNFLRLETLHPDEQEEFRHAIHQVQSLIMCRPVQREFNAEIKEYTKP